MTNILNRGMVLLSVVWAVVGCTARAPEVPPFDVEKARTLSPARRAQLDVEFFNEFATHRERGYVEPGGRPISTEPRVARIHAMANEGFEVAYLAERLFNLGAGVPNSSAQAVRYWRRVKELALAGDASAQCFIWNAEWLLRDEFDILPLPDADEPSRYKALEQAALQGHPACMGDWGNYRYTNDPVARAAWNLKGARLGCLICQLRIAYSFGHGDGVNQNGDVAWCWINEARARSKSFKVIRDAQAIAFVIQKDHIIEPSVQLKRYMPGTYCEQLDPSGATIDLKLSLKTIVFGDKE